jgi:hypothetical protein
MTKVSIIREPDDPIADARISIGSPRGSEDFYFVFRGDPEQVIALLEKALPVVKAAFSANMYDDRTTS